MSMSTAMPRTLRETGASVEGAPPSGPRGCNVSHRQGRTSKGGTVMPTYVLMTKLTPAALQVTSGRRAAGHDWKTKVETVCPGIRWIGHYALLGPYDFMDI